MPNALLRSFVLLGAVVTAAACADADASVASATDATPAADNAEIITLTETEFTAVAEAAGVARAIREATLSTKLMAAVTAVPVVAGTPVRAGQTLVTLDARDLAAKREQVRANRDAARAMQVQAAAQAARIRALYADNAAPKAMLEQAEAGLAQAESTLRAAEAAAVELGAVESYATLTAPFDGVVTQRFVDPGAFAAPGAPLVTVQDATQLRVTVHVAPSVARTLRTGTAVPVRIEGVTDTAIIEGVVPAMGGLHAVNALVPNRDGRHLAGSAATLAVPVGTQRGLAVPQTALIREGDLVGVVLRSASGDVRRWIRTGATRDGLVEVTAGLRAGDQVVLPKPAGVE